MASYLRKSIYVLLLTILIAVSGTAQQKVPILSFAQSGADAPHWDNGIDCQSCHTLHNGGGVKLTTVAGNANLCISCHNPAGFAQGKPMTYAERAVPGQSGTSHAWDRPANNPQFGAQAPVNEQMATRLSDDNIVCSTCHNQHSQEFAPFLRISNFQNGLCKECHVVRNVGSYRESPNNLGSHPVGVAYPGSDSLYFSSPKDSRLELFDPDRVECMTCHGVHYTDSGNANNGAGDGYLLTMANGDQLCQSCHVFTDHMGMGCRKCHQPHDPNQTNILLVRSEVTTPNSGTRPVVFTAESGPNSFADGDNTFDGICEVCHTQTSYHQNSSGGDHQHNVGTNCTDCHLHIKSFLPPPCVECHNQPQDNGDGVPAGGRRAIVAELDMRSHHVQSDITDDDCKVCHDQDTHADGYVDLNDPDGGPSYRALSFQDGPPAQFCLNCHDSDGATAHGGTSPFSDGNQTIDVSQFYLSSGHGKNSRFDLLLAQGPITDPMSGTDVTLYSDTANPAANLKCTNCHGTHGAQNDGILKHDNDQNNTLCNQCHPSAASTTGYYLTAFNRTVSDYERSEHKNLLCTRCHNPHGTGNPGMTTQSLDQLCLTCHTDRGSFRDLMLDVNYDHGNNRCSNCHNPHGTGNEPLLLASYTEDAQGECTDAVGQRLPVLTNPSTDLAFCFTCHIDANSAGSHDPSRCFACHGWYDPGKVLGQACGSANIKEFIDFKIHDEGDGGAPVDLGFSGLCLDCHFCGGDCGVASQPSALAGGLELMDSHPDGANCDGCHKPHTNQINYPPVLIQNQGVMLDEDALRVIDNRLLQASDAESGAGSVAFTLKKVPDNGILELDGFALRRRKGFTQADIDRGGITYQHDGSETTSDRFIFNVSDSDDAHIENMKFSITINPVNDPPLLRTINKLQVDEGQQAQLSPSELDVADDDNSAVELMVRLLSRPAHGNLSLDNEALQTGDVFSQVAVRKRRIAYQHDGGETTADGFDFEITDGQAVVGPFALVIAINPINDSPELVTNEPLHLDEGDKAGIDATHLTSQDVDNAAAEVIYKITSVSVHGELRNGGKKLKVGDEFSQEDIDVGRVSYQHDGGETTNDAFEITVADKAGGSGGSATFEITINPVNDLPAIVAAGDLHTTEGAEVHITPDALQVTDEESAADQIEFKITRRPVNGELRLVGGVLDSGDSFSQSAVDAGQLTYAHNASETISDLFRFDVTDGDGGKVSGNDFHISVTPVNDPPELARNKTLTLDEEGGRTISDNRLRVTDADNIAAELVFTITRNPAHGKLIHDQNGEMAQSGTFTQEDINRDRLRYQHDGSETTRDRFRFDVDDGAGGLIDDVSFEIRIKPVNDQPVLAKNSRTSLDEGDTKTINESRLRVTDAESDPKEIVFTLESPPAAGVLVLNGRGLGRGDTFTQDNLDDNDLRYVHSGSEADSDRFKFSVSDGDGGNIEKTDHRFRIRPVNDDPILAKNSGITLDEGSAVVVDSSALRVTDADNDTDELDFRVVAAPKHARLLRRGSLLQEKDKFTQRDLDRKDIEYQHNGSETTQDSLVFRLDDGDGGRIGESTLRFNITAINDSPVVMAPGPLNVPEDGVLAVPAISVVDEDAEDELVQLTASARHAVLSLHDSLNVMVQGNRSPEIVVQARLSAINALLLDSLRYRPSPDFDGTDAIALTLDDLGHSGEGGARTARTTIPVTVASINDAPVVAANAGLTLDEGETKKIRASELATVDVDNSGDEIVYELNQAPTWGTLQLQGRTLREKQTFTQADIDAEDLRYRHDGSETSDDSMQLSVSDGTASDDLLFRIEIRPVNDPPHVKAPEARDGVEDMDLAIPAITITDDDAGAVALEFTATVEHGVLLLPSSSRVTLHGVGSGKLTVRGAQDDLNSALDETLLYRPDANFAGEDLLDIRVDDQGGSGSGGARLGTASIVLRLAAVNDPPHITTNSVMTVAEGKDQVVEQRLLEVTDPDNRTSELVFNLLAAPVNGVLEINGRASGVGDTFTQAQIDDRRVRYRHNGGESLQDSLEFTVSDGSGGSIARTPFAIVVTPVNDPPKLAVPGPQTGTEDHEMIIPAIAMSDADAGLERMELSARVDNGKLALANAPGVAVSGSGTANLIVRGEIDDLNRALDGALIYDPEADFDGGDKLKLTLSDEGHSGNGGAKTDKATIALLLNPVNDPPLLSVNAGLGVDEDTTAFITPSELLADDVDHGPDELVFTVMTAPANGMLLLDATQLDSSDIFTQKDISRARLSYRHNGGETERDTVVFDVTDGESPALRDSILITIRPINDPPMLSVPGAQAVLEDTELTLPVITFADVDADGGDVEITASAGHGSLQLMNSDALTLRGNVSSELTMRGSIAAVNAALNGFLVYRPDPDFYGPDKVILAGDDLGNGGRQAEQVTGLIDIMVSGVNDPPRVVANSIVEVDSSAAVTISSENLRAVDTDNAAGELIFTVVGTPLNGSLLLNGATALAENSDFSQDDIDHDRLTYQHAGGTATQDSVDFVLRDSAGTATPVRTIRIAVRQNMGSIGPAESASTASDGGSEKQLEAENALRLDK